jgi:formylglycine-generating enzyme required for sulfatase activity
MHAAWKHSCLFALAVCSACPGCDPTHRVPLLCEQPGDCAAGWTCLQGRCVVIECTTADDCAADQRCVDFACVEITPCSSDAQCTGGQRCVQGACACASHASQACQGDEVWWFDSCGEPEARITTCPAGCSAGQCDGCEPGCGARECGPDPICGQSCGACQAGEACDADGRCQGPCTPDCAGRACGPDPDCGQSCGTCQAGEACDADGQCQGPCTPDCAGRACGPDPICGQSCGACQAAESCNLAGQCGPWCELGAARCSPDGYGVEACGPDPQDPERNTFGPRVPCPPDIACDDATASCALAACLESEVIILLDRSSSMTASGAWAWVEPALLEALGLRQAVNWLGFREFPAAGAGGCTTGGVLAPALDNAAAIAAAMHAPTADSATPLAAALQGFLDRFGDPNAGQAVVLLTDGAETCATPQAAVAAAAALYRAGVRVYVVAITTSADRVLLDQLAAAGGTGSARLARDAGELVAALDASFEDLHACQCAAGAQRCVGGALFACADDRDAWLELRDCPLGCAADGLACQTCAPGALACRADALGVCAPDGESFAPLTACERGCLDERHCRGAMLAVPAGAVLMGSDEGLGDLDEQPQRTVEIGAYSLDLLEVTNAEYQDCVTAGVCSEPASTSSSTRAAYYGAAEFAAYPVLNVSWLQAKQFCLWAGKRLPSEAEWERAARGDAPDERTYPWGEATATCSLAAYGSCDADTDEAGAHPAGRAPFGHLDLAGNVYEWVEDWYDSLYDETALDDPLGPVNGTTRVARGGGWNSDAVYIRVANRSYREPLEVEDNRGFRCARSPAAADHDRDGVSPQAGDCDDGDPATRPGAGEVCLDGLDNDCDGDTDTGCTTPLVLENATDLPIPDTGTWVSSTLVAQDSRVLVGARVYLEVVHPYVGDLQIELRHPDGTVVSLWNNAGAEADDIYQEFSLPTLIGKSAQGTWTLRLIDTATPDAGTLDLWRLTLE